jgi:Rad3-related DNA helicase
MIKQDGEEKGFCPYYYACHIKEKVDVIFMPYNYLLDVDRLNYYTTVIKDSVIIFDEAHNVA